MSISKNQFITNIGEIDMGDLLKDLIIEVVIEVGKRVLEDI